MPLFSIIADGKAWKVGTSYDMGDDRKPEYLPIGKNTPLLRGIRSGGFLLE